MTNLHEDFEEEFNSKLKAHGKLMSDTRLDLLRVLLAEITGYDNLSQAIGLIHNKIDIEEMIQKANDYE